MVRSRHGTKYTCPKCSREIILYIPGTVWCVGGEPDTMKKHHHKQVQMKQGVAKTSS